MLKNNQIRKVTQPIDQKKPENAVASCQYSVNWLFFPLCCFHVLYSAAFLNIHLSSCGNDANKYAIRIFYISSLLQTKQKYLST